MKLANEGDQHGRGLSWPGCWPSIKRKGNTHLSRITVLQVLLQIYMVPLLSPQNTSTRSNIAAPSAAVGFDRFGAQSSNRPRFIMWYISASGVMDGKGVGIT